MARPDIGHRLTDRALVALERRISAVYAEARDSLEESVRAYFESFRRRDEDMQKLIGQVLNGREWTEQDYKQWRLSQIGRGERFEALKEKIARRYTLANETAIAYVNDATPGVYALNRNYAAYTIERVSGSADFTLWDEQTVKRLIVEQPDLMPYYPKEKAARRGIDLAWGKRQITAAVTSSILQGKSIKGISDDLQTRIPEMNRTSAVRAARTAVTGAQNAGRMDSYVAAQNMGIRLKREWLATLDNRTRHAHAMLDGQQAEMDEPFKSELGDIMYPGDPKADPANIYNCRCTLIAVVDDVDTSDAKRRAIDPETGESVPVSDMTYQEWEAWKKSENAEAWDTYMKKGRSLSADREQWEEYRRILGKNAPSRFAEFQNLKYNDAEKWEELKTKKRQTVVVENAPCVTTPKKFTGYFLKPGAKHADQFFNVGYTQDNPLLLRYDMARQFKMSKAVDVEVLEDGAMKFNLYMKLGVSKERTFKTGWRIDKPGDKPRIITGFRKDNE